MFRGGGSTALTTALGLAALVRNADRGGTGRSGDTFTTGTRDPAYSDLPGVAENKAGLRCILLDQDDPYFQATIKEVSRDR